MPATYQYVYQVTASGSTYTTGGGTKTDLTGTGTSQVAEVSGGTDDNNQLSNGELLTATGITGVTGNLTYVGSLPPVAGKHGAGFVATAADGKSYFFTDSALPNANQTLEPSAATPTPICFMMGTRIRTPNGEVNVEDLKAGDLVITAEGSAAPVRWIGRQTVSTLFADPLRILPIRIKTGALAEGMPARDLLLSSDHALLIDGVLVQAGALVNGSSIVRETNVPTTFTYYHVEAADHSLILAEGVPAETFVDNVDRLAFDNWDEHEAAESEAPIAEMDLPRAKSARQVPMVTRQRLAARAAAVSGVAVMAA